MAKGGFHSSAARGAPWTKPQMSAACFCRPDPRIHPGAGRCSGVFCAKGSCHTTYTALRRDRVDVSAPDIPVPFGVSSGRPPGNASTPWVSIPRSRRPNARNNEGKLTALSSRTSPCGTPSSPGAAAKRALRWPRAVEVGRGSSSERTHRPGGGMLRSEPEFVCRTGAGYANDAMLIRTCGCDSPRERKSRQSSPRGSGVQRARRWRRRRHRSRPRRWRRPHLMPQ